jgi:hypothetical protein
MKSRNGLCAAAARLLGGFICRSWPNADPFSPLPSQILLFGAEFTRVCANRAGHRVEPSEHVVPIQRKEIEKPAS